MKNGYIKKPTTRNGSWVVIIAESNSPLAKEIDIFYCGGRESAFQTYRRLLKERGHAI